MTVFIIIWRGSLFYFTYSRVKSTLVGDSAATLAVCTLCGLSVHVNMK